MVLGASTFQRRYDEWSSGKDLTDCDCDFVLSIMQMADLFSPQLLQELTSNKEMRRESLYYLATVLYRLEKYADARQVLKKLLTVDPESRQAQDLKAAVEHVLQRDGAIGLAVLSGAAVAAFAVGAALLKKR